MGQQLQHIHGLAIVVDSHDQSVLVAANVEDSYRFSTCNGNSICMGIHPPYVLQAFPFRFADQKHPLFQRFGRIGMLSTEFAQSLARNNAHASTSLSPAKD